MSTSGIVELPRTRLARITGGMYLAFVLAMIVADSVGHIGVSEVQQAFEVLSADPWSFVVGLVFGLLSAFLFAMAAWGLYVLLKPVNADLALLFLLLNAIGVAIQVGSYFPYQGRHRSIIHGWYIAGSHHEIIVSPERTRHLACALQFGKEYLSRIWLKAAQRARHHHFPGHDILLGSSLDRTHSEHPTTRGIQPPRNHRLQGVDHLSRQHDGIYAPVWNPAWGR